MLRVDLIISATLTEKLKIDYEGLQNDNSDLQSLINDLEAKVKEMESYSRGRICLKSYISKQRRSLTPLNQS